MSKVIIPYKYQIELDDELPLWHELESKHSVHFLKYHMGTPEEFIQYINEEQINCIWITEDFFTYLGGPAPYWDHFPDSLKAIVVPWVGCDFIDGKRLWEEKGIVLCNVGPNAASNVSELCLYLVLSCFRMTSFSEYCFKFIDTGDVDACKDHIGSKKSDVITHTLTNNEGKSFEYKYPKKKTRGEVPINIVQNYNFGGKHIVSPSNKNALILGFGSIGQMIGKKLNSAFNMKIHYYKRTGPVPKDILGYEATYVNSLDDSKVWCDIDVIILSLPSNPESDNIINKKTLAMCKDGVRVVNVGRGSCINEDDLLDALDSGKVNSCGLDVYKNEETKVNENLLSRWDVTALPHMGSAEYDIVLLETQITLENIEDIFVKGGHGIYTVNR
ncbi:similar to Saccharomyces cerevisiae YPL113C Glyoxylate reductase [Maudiozyma saulgeensis]|uniref:Similar to Saccharomyces cerevisiae YPL113C Glyoxylate reductase n=1 Tax=Maudiozyma saulgeensis TaxID=1789683 RepID=A0A1X7R9L7_9SACH|nr:similar to Saccharomyces cerevisiae YPL113C Glyoxylate reductase [Kazachstania saulgeensis]